MGSSGKKRTTMAKLNRESKLRDKRADKEARKTARKMTAAGNGPAPEPNGDEPEARPTSTDAAMSDEDSRTLAQARSSDSPEPAAPSS